MSELRYPNEGREYREARDLWLKEEQELVDKVKPVAAKRRPPILDSFICVREISLVRFSAAVKISSGADRKTFLSLRDLQS